MARRRAYSTWDPFGFAGSSQYQTDSDSGLKLLGHRYYDPTIGRFLSQYPIQAGTNWYAYCENGPLGGIDPSGEEDIKFGGDRYHRHLGDEDKMKGWPHWDGPRGWIGNDGRVRDGNGGMKKVPKATKDQIDKQIGQLKARGLGGVLKRPKDSPEPPFEPEPAPPTLDPYRDRWPPSEPAEPFPGWPALGKTFWPVLGGAAVIVVIIVDPPAAIPLVLKPVLAR